MDIGKVWLLFMNGTALVIMAAGIGSRFGGGIKQLERVGPSGEIIMDYSIYDAIKAGFNKVVFIIRRDLEQDFKEIIGNRIAAKLPVSYVFQESDMLPEGFTRPEGRSKPWGTGQAVLCCKDTVKEPFAVINADDYYGKEAFIKVHDYLCNLKHNPDIYHYCMAGFVLGNTLSENGTVTRGVCQTDDNQMLKRVEETFDILKKGERAVGRKESGETVKMPLDSQVSMNMWGFTPNLFYKLEQGFIEFLSNMGDNAMKAEYLLPGIIGSMIIQKQAEVKVLKTNDKWFGITYKEDKQAVVDTIKAMVNAGEYPESIL